MESGRVIVIGAGLSGLVTAWRLRQAGVEVVVLEATDRVGGRAYTVNEGLEDGQYADFGGELVASSYHAFAAMCEEMGVELSDAVPYARPHPDDLSAVEGYLRSGRFVIDGRVITAKEADAIGLEVRAAAAESPPAAHEIVEQWVRRARLSAPGTAVVRSLSRMLNQLDPWDSDVHFVFGASDGEFRRVVGGTQRLADALAPHLDVRLNQHVTRVQRVGGVRVETEGGDVFEGSRVVAAVAPFALPQIGFDPPLPEEKTMAILSLLPAMGGKVVAQYAEGDAVREALTHVQYSDDEFSAAWVSSPHVTTGPAVVTGFLAGVHRHMLADEDAALAALDEFVAIGVGAPVTRVAGFIKNWWLDPLHLSVTVTPPESARSELSSTITAQERRTHIAGDYTDIPMSGTLEGAVRSGLRVVDEILRAPLRFPTDLVDERLARA